MNEIMNMLISGLELSPDLIFVARIIVVILVVDVLSNLVSAIVPLVKSLR